MSGQFSWPNVVIGDNNIFCIRRDVVVIINTTNFDLKRKVIDMKTSPEIAKNILLEFENGLDLPTDKEGKLVFKETRTDEEKYHIALLIGKGYISKPKTPGYESPKYFLSRKGQAFLAVLSNENLVKEQDDKLVISGYTLMKESILFNLLESIAESLLPSDKKCNNPMAGMMEMLSFSFSKTMENKQDHIDVDHSDAIMDRLFKSAEKPAEVIHDIKDEDMA